MINSKMVKVAKELRSNMTLAEKLLWQRLRNRQINNLKFYRQYPFVFGDYNFVADFYCHEVKLIIEVEGKIHQNNEVKGYDKFREEIFLVAGYNIIVFSNQEVIESIDEVIDKIIKIIKQKIKNKTLSRLGEGRVREFRESQRGGNKNGRNLRGLP